ncbi:MAG: hypothetical protein ACHQE5_11370 [Actinomycetes bacterium]
MRFDPIRADVLGADGPGHALHDRINAGVDVASAASAGAAPPATAAGHARSHR